tara:strand:+ start:53 stop:283 length:231 start_codon:yes stop_codon:yes gene_type:complete
MSNKFKPLGFAQWVNKYGKQLCDLYDDWIEDTGTDKFDVSILDFEEREYRKSKHYLYTEEIDCDVMNILVANGGVA